MTINFPNITISFIGGGNMATAIIGGLLQAGMKRSCIQVADPSELQRDKLQTTFDITTAASYAALPHPGDVAVIAVKPQIMSDVVNPIADTLMSISGPIISIAAGVRMRQLEAWLPNQCPIVRVMPNTPALIGQGASALFANTHCAQSHIDIADALLRAVGETAWVDSDEMMDAITALSGSGPAYFFHFMELMQHCATELGLDSELAERFTLQTALGAVQLAKDQGKPFGELRKQVTSPGGTTERALGIFQEYGLQGTVCEAMHGAYTRSQQLSDEIEAQN